VRDDLPVLPGARLSIQGSASASVKNDCDVFVGRVPGISISMGCTVDYLNDRTRCTQVDPATILPPILRATIGRQSSQVAGLIRSGQTSMIPPSRCLPRSIDSETRRSASGRARTNNGRDTKGRKPDSSHPRTGSSNPVPSSGESLQTFGPSSGPWD
jgi:hypothetical protein